MYWIGGALGLGVLWWVFGYSDPTWLVAAMLGMGCLSVFSSR